MKTSLLVLLALSALSCACHERRQDPPPDYDAVRARAHEAGSDVQRENPPASGEAR